MGRNLIEIYDAPVSRIDDETPPFAYLPDRATTHERLRSVRGVDLIVIGCGHLGATCAHLAAINDLRVLLVHPAQAAPYQPSTASAFIGALLGRNSAPVIPSLAGAGDDVRQLYRRAPHLIQTMPLAFIGLRPLRRRLQNAFALTIWGITSKVPSSGLFNQKLASIDDQSLIAETALAAQQEGALYLNNISLSYLESESESQCYVLGINDPIAETKTEIRCGAVVIDPGAGWLPGSRLASAGHQRRFGGVYDLHIDLAAGAQAAEAFIVAHQKWPALLVHNEERSSITFPNIPYEILKSEEISSHITATLQTAGISPVRVVSTRITRRVADDRRLIKQRGGIFELSMRGPWDALPCSHEVIKRIFAAAGDPRSLTPLRERSLPGDTRDGRLISEFLKECTAYGISTATAEGCVNRWYGRVRSIFKFPNGHREIVSGILQGELSLSMAADGASSLSDVAIGSLKVYRMQTWREIIVPLAKVLGELQRRDISDIEMAACVQSIDELAASDSE